jgi:hypothetical protein
LWKTSQRSATLSDGPVKSRSFDPYPSLAYDTDYPPQTVNIFGEWERLPVGGVHLQVGDYLAQIILTEESFHGSGGTYAGNWAAAMGGQIDFSLIIDSDGDGIPDSEDNCPNKPNGTNLGTCSSTSDKPEINCTSAADCANGCSSNGLCIKDQRDTDSDGFGDVCDICDGNGAADTDNDGYCDLEDNCPTKCNTQQLDADGDGIGDVCDTTPGCGGCGQSQCENQC